MLKFASRYYYYVPSSAPRYHRILGDTDGGREKGETAGREREKQMETERKRQRGIHRVEK
jgi:hypothetical protein